MSTKDETYVIWSHEHKQWWGRNHCGYVEEIEDAGIYSRAEAIDITFDHVPAGEEVAIPHMYVRNYINSGNIHGIDPGALDRQRKLMGFD